METAVIAENVPRSDAAGPPLRDRTNNQLIIDLLQTLNHLSRWLTPIHDWDALEFSRRRSDPSVKDLLLDLRDTEIRVFSFLRAIANEDGPDLDKIPRPERTPAQEAIDRDAQPLVVMSEFRRVRQSSLSGLRALPDTAWQRDGYSRQDRNWTIRQLAEFLVAHDRDVLERIDRALNLTAARAEIAAVSQVGLAELSEPFVSVATRE
jgi:hypothetical protein